MNRIEACLRALRASRLWATTLVTVATAFAPALAQSPAASQPANADAIGRDLEPPDPDGLLGVDKSAGADEKYVGNWNLKFTGKRVDGKEVSFPDDYKGKLVLVIFWSTLDPKFDQEISFWRTAHDRFAGKNFDVLGVLTDEYRGQSLDVTKSALQKLFVPFQNVYSRGQAIAHQSGVRRLPHAFLVNGDTGGVLFQSHQIRRENLIRRIQLLLVRHNVEAGADEAKSGGPQQPEAPRPRNPRRANPPTGQPASGPARP